MAFRQDGLGDRAKTRTAGSLLRAAGVDLAEVRRLLPGLEPYEVAVRPAPAAVRAVWGPSTAAMAMAGVVWVRPDLLVPGRLPPGLLLHELVHTRQWRRMGRVGFLRRYLGAYAAGRLRGLSHHDAYMAIPQEDEARRLGGWR
jgi:hypothetical protein